MKKLFFLFGILILIISCCLITGGDKKDDTIEELALRQAFLDHYDDLASSSINSRENIMHGNSQQAKVSSLIPMLKLFSYYQENTTLKRKVQISIDEICHSDNIIACKGLTVPRPKSCSMGTCMPFPWDYMQFVRPGFQIEITDKNGNKAAEITDIMENGKMRKKIVFFKTGGYRMKIHVPKYGSLNSFSYSMNIIRQK